MATFLLFALAALLVLWVNSDAWGTVADTINALLVGAGAFLGTAAFKSMRDAGPS